MYTSSRKITIRNIINQVQSHQLRELRKKIFRFRLVEVIVRSLVLQMSILTHNV